MNPKNYRYFSLDKYNLIKDTENDVNGYMSFDDKNYPFLVF